MSTPNRGDKVILPLPETWQKAEVDPELAMKLLRYLGPLLDALKHGTYTHGAVPVSSMFRFPPAARSPCPTVAPVASTSSLSRDTRRAASSALPRTLT